MFSITLQNPFYLTLLGLLAVPIIIHLYQRKKYTKIEFSSLKFLQLASIRLDYFSRIKNILLLFTRCLLIILFALFLARPMFKTKVSGFTNKISNTSYVVILDNSLSMTYLENKKTRKDIARDILEKILNSFDSTCKGKIIFAPDYKLIDISNYKIPETPFYEFDMKRAIFSAYQYLKDMHFPVKDIYIISDFQENNFKKEMEEFSFKDINFYLFDLGKKNDWNIFISDVKTDEIITEGRETKISVIISNYNLKEKMNILVTLDIENNEIETKECEVYPGKQSIINFFYKFTTSGHFDGYVKLQDDNLPKDNKYFINFKVVKNISVLCIGEKQEDTFYLKYALSPNYLKKDEIITTTAISYPELNKVNLNNFDVVVISNIKKIDNITFKNYLRRGGNIIVFLGENIDSNSYNKNIFNKIQIKNIINKTSSLTSLDFRSRIFNEFKNPQEANFSQIKFFRYYELHCMGSCSILAKFDYKTPAILEERIGNGKILVFNTSTQDTFSNFHLTPMFVPTLHSAIYHLQQKDIFLTYYYTGDKTPLPHTYAAGNYEMPDKTQSSKKIISINYKRDESNLSKIPPHKFKLFFGKNFKYFKIPSDNLSNLKRYGYKNFDNIIIYALFLMLLVEILLLLW